MGLCLAEVDGERLRLRRRAVGAFPVRRADDAVEPLGNLAFHLADHTGARAHPAAAVLLGERCAADDLRAWRFGAASMVARADRRHDAALVYAKRGLAKARYAARCRGIPLVTTAYRLPNRIFLDQPGTPTSRSWRTLGT